MAGVTRGQRGCQDGASSGTKTRPACDQDHAAEDDAGGDEAR